MKITDLKVGVLIELDNIPYRVVESQHSSLGRGGAVMKTKLKNLVSGAMIEKTFRGQEQVPSARIDQQPVQYLYQADDGYVFMDQASFEQFTVNRDIIEPAISYVPEGGELELWLYEGKVIGYEVARSVWLKVTETETGLKGDSATGSTKPATLETGLVVQVPLFINQGDVLKIDTRTGQYIERQK